MLLASKSSAITCANGPGDGKAIGSELPEKRIRSSEEVHRRLGCDRIGSDDAIRAGPETPIQYGVRRGRVVPSRQEVTVSEALSAGPGLDSIDLISPDKFARGGYPHAEWTRLRKEAPVYWYERDHCDPFWAITKHADIVEIGKRSDDFVIGPRIAIFPNTVVVDEERTHHLLNMDPPEHGKYRRIASKWFTPRMTQRWAPRIEAFTRQTLDSLAGERSFDFVAECSAPITIAVIAEMLGLPQEDWKLLFRWTNEIIAPDEPEFQRGRTSEATIAQATTELFEYFVKLADERRRSPKEDILSVIVQGEVDGSPMPIRELLSYYELLVVAGNETTRNAMTGGLLAFIERPEEWERLRAEPERLDSAVEEIVRWTTPVIQFARTATRDVEIRGKTIRKGESVGLFYPSGNRDEDVFDDPFVFRIDRGRSDHVGFGRGTHVCMGAHLARLELKTMFSQLRERATDLAVTGDVERVHSSFVGGIKRAPIHWTLA
jgi:cholest-4-en-3-one 26-monooxygenase